MSERLRYAAAVLFSAGLALASAYTLRSQPSSSGRPAIETFEIAAGDSCDACADLASSMSDEAPLLELSAVKLATPWIPAAERRRLAGLDIAFKDHDERTGALGDLFDRPALLAFFYTRCQNGSKCSAVVSRLATLQRRLEGLDLRGKVRLLVITYEPGFDTPQRMKQYASQRGLSTNQDARMIQLDPRRHSQLTDELEIPVSYNSGWVNTHGVELTLIDARGRLVRKYRTKLWDDALVIRDLQTVLEEK